MLVTVLYIQAGGNGPSVLVTVRPVFLEIKMKFHAVLQKVSNKTKGASGLLGLLYNKLIGRKSKSRGARLLATYTVCFQGVCCAKS